MSKEEIKDENLDNFLGLYDQYKKDELELLKKDYKNLSYTYDNLCQEKIEIQTKYDNLISNITDVFNYSKLNHKKKRFEDDVILQTLLDDLCDILNMEES